MRKAGVGYQRRGATSHRKYNWSKSVKRYKRTGNFRTVSGGSGHRAGESWGDAKAIDPDSKQRRYSKNSPSFDEGVYLSKKKRAMAKRMQKE